MAVEEGWGAIAEIAAHLQVAKNSIYRWVDAKGFPARRGGTIIAIQALGGGRVGEGRRR